MKLLYSPSSPFVRKVMITIMELGIEDKITIERAPVHPINFNKDLIKLNPLGQVPTLIDGDTVIYDSGVICQYLDSKFGNKVFGDKEVNWESLRDQALADSMLNSALIIRYELTVRSEDHQNKDWIDGQMRKIKDGLKAFESSHDNWVNKFDIGNISLICLLGYLDFKFEDFDWRAENPKTAIWYDTISDQKSSVSNTKPKV